MLWCDHVYGVLWGFWVIISNAWHVFCRSFVTSVVGAPSSQIASCTYDYVQNDLERREVEIREMILSMTRLCCNVLCLVCVAL